MDRVWNIFLNICFHTHTLSLSIACGGGDDMYLSGPLLGGRAFQLPLRRCTKIHTQNSHHAVINWITFFMPQKNNVHYKLKFHIVPTKTATAFFDLFLPGHAQYYPLKKRTGLMLYYKTGTGLGKHIWGFKTEQKLVSEHNISKA